MDNTIRDIIGGEEESEGTAAPIPTLGGAGENGSLPVTPEDAETEELANLWKTGNKGEVITRYMDMDNEQSVKLVFAIGYEGAVELAAMVDQMIEQGDFPGDDKGSTEPEKIEPPSEHIAVQDILGTPDETSELVPA